MPGGKIAPDGRPAQAPGVGAQSKRHDLEMPGTPGLHGSDLQQGDVQMLEQGQRVAPRPKRTQPPAAPQGRPQQGGQASQGQQMQVPDAISFAAGRMGNQVDLAPSGQGSFQVDPTPWMPLLEAFAIAPNSSGPMVSSLVEQLANFRRNPVATRSNLIDLNEADEVLTDVLRGTPTIGG